MSIRNGMVTLSLISLAIGLLIAGGKQGWAQSVAQSSIDASDTEPADFSVAEDRIVPVQNTKRAPKPPKAPASKPQKPAIQPRPLSRSPQSANDRQVASLFDSRRSFRRGPFRRLAAAPDMFGDSTFAGTFDVNTGIDFVYGRLPSQERNKIADNGTPDVRDRVYFDYRHFHNAFEINRPVGGSNKHVERYRFGIEKTFGCESWSVELRVPVSGSAEFDSPDFSYDGDGFGNIGVIFKKALHRSEDLVVSGGLGINIPTGDDVEIDLPLLTGRLEIKNEAVHLMPFLGFLATPDDRWFFQGFFQVDVPANGNPLLGDGNVEGILDDQTLLYFDLSGGVWWYRNDCECSSGLTGLASIVELHYTTTPQDADSVTALAGAAVLGNASARVDAINLTVGFHAELGHDTALRFGVALPLRNADDRTFDAELIATIIRRF